MKKILLALIFTSFLTQAQNNCGTAIVISSNDTYTLSDISSEGGTPCFGATDAGGAPLMGYWYAYTPSQNGEVTVSSDLTENQSPYSENTRLSILVGNCSNLSCYDSADDVNSAAQNYLTTLTFPVQANQTYYLVWDSFWEANGFDFDFTFTASSCVRPYYVSEPTSVTENSITLNWEESVSGNVNYTVEYGLQGFALGSGTTANTNNPSISLSNLTSGGSYDYYIKTDCAGNNSSSFAGPFQFNLNKTLPYSSGFDDAQQLAGWTRVNADANFNLITNAANALSAPNYYVINALIGTINDYWLMSPAIEFQDQLSATLKFNLRTSPANVTRIVTFTLGTSADPATHTQIIAAEPALSSNPNYSEFSYNFTAPAAGAYYIGLHDTSATSVNSSMRIDNFSVSTNLSTSDLTSENIEIYPNPVNNVLFIDNNSEETYSRIEVLNAEGKLIRELNMRQTDGFNVSDLSSGLYFLKLTSDKSSLVKKFVKK